MKFPSRVLVVAATVLGAIAIMPDVAAASYEPLPAPRRLTDTRPGMTTVDGQAAGVGIRPGGSTFTLKVAGRANLPTNASSVVLNVTATQALSNGYVTVYPCDQSRPTASNLNFVPGQSTANTVITKLSSAGTVCIYTHATTHVVVDVAGTMPADTLTPLPAPRRLTDTRPGMTTVDGQAAGAGIRPGGSTFTLKVAGRANLPTNASSVVLNVTATQALSNGYVTVYPCDQSRPTASNLNFVPGQSTANTVITKLSSAGTVCIYTHATTHVVVDVAGTLEASSFIPIPNPQRLADTRPGMTTVDGDAAGRGIRPAGGTLQLQVTGRANIPANASSVVLNVTATGAQSNGYVTVHPRSTGRPTASNLNFVPGQSTANAVIARVGSGGQVCIYTHAATHVVVDVAGYLTGPPPPSSGTPCPADPIVPRTFGPGQYIVGSQIPAGRYEANATLGCYWERQSGFSGSINDVLANDFQAFTGRMIVDILPTDAGFEFDADCGTLTTYVPVSTRASSIVPGAHVVGQHIRPGTYQTNAADGCYWERMTSFDGTLSSVITNDFVDSPGPQIVTIETTDVGFRTDDDCGTWHRV